MNYSTQILDKRANARVKNSVAFLYIEHAIVEQDEFSIQIIRGKSTTAIPIANINCIILGPGTSITHRAVESIAETDCLLVWSGENMRAFYASGRHGETSCKNMLRQAEYWADKEKHIEVVRKMYSFRFSDMPTDTMSLQRLRGAEGKRVSNLYRKFAEEYGVEWSGRNYDKNNWDKPDDINRLLSIGNNYLYNICHAVILTLGFSPELGFIHTGKMRSFVWDIADIYKPEIVMPVAFQVCKDGGDDSELRREMSEKIWEEKFMTKIVKNLYELFDLKSGESVSAFVLPELWAGEKFVLGGKNHAK